VNWIICGFVVVFGVACGSGPVTSASGSSGSTGGATASGGAGGTSADAGEVHCAVDSDCPVQPPSECEHWICIPQPAPDPKYPGVLLGCTARSWEQGHSCSAGGYDVEGESLFPECAGTCTGPGAACENVCAPPGGAPEHCFNACLVK
jgi:hypothetical protein